PDPRDLGALPWESEPGLRDVPHGLRSGEEADLDDDPGRPRGPPPGTVLVRVSAGLEEHPVGLDDDGRGRAGRYLRHHPLLELRDLGDRRMDRRPLRDHPRVRRLGRLLVPGPEALPQRQGHVEAVRKLAWTREYHRRLAKKVKR